VLLLLLPQGEGQVTIGVGVLGREEQDRILPEINTGTVSRG
jgi:hypothetical protein